MVEQEFFGTLAEHFAIDQPGLRASLVGAQVMGVVMARYVIAVEPLASAAPETVAAMIAPNFQRLLTATLPAATTPSSG